MTATKEEMREALIACRQHIKETRGSWWNDRSMCDLMTKYINPALDLDPWDDYWIDLKKERGELSR